MQTFNTKKAAIAYAVTMGWTGADANLAFKSLQLPLDEVALLNIMAQFSGPVMKERQFLQSAQKGQVTKKLKYIQKIEIEHADSIQKFKDEVEHERSQWLGLIRIMYGIASKFGMKDPMIEHILKTYDNAA
jgi:hypothetical protein